MDYDERGVNKQKTIDMKRGRDKWVKAEELGKTGKLKLGKTYKLKLQTAGRGSIENGKSKTGALWKYGN